MSRPRKLPEEKAKPRNLTFSPKIWELIEQRATALGFSSASAYIADLVRRDAGLLNAPEWVTHKTGAVLQQDTGAEKAAVDLRNKGVHDAETEKGK